MFLFQATVDILKCFPKILVGHKYLVTNTYITDNVQKLQSVDIVTARNVLSFLQYQLEEVTTPLYQC